ncbi:MAG: hypothetical protein K2G87_11260 [Oscillospiraceae bacterium]|nr:hypothetical protein [Oscillospiraceae bacterium]
MKEAVYKFFTAVLTVLIFFGILHSMSILSNLNDYNYAKREAEKNSGLAAAGYEIPAVSANAPAEAMRTEPAPITADDLSYIYIDGIKLDFPFTLADIQAHFDTRKFIENYDEENSEYNGAYILVKNDVGSYRIDFTADSESPLPEECTVKMICDIGFSEKYSPQIIIAGMDIFRISEEEFYRLSALDMKEYLTSTAITYEHENGGYISLNFISNGYGYNIINYCEKDNPEDMETAGQLNPILTKTELRLPDDYDAETVSEDKEELRDFALEYYAYERIYDEKIDTTINDLYITAYEFLAEDSDEYNALYYELTDIESLKKYDDDNHKIDTGYLRVFARCYIEGYDEPVQTTMILKPGDRLGDALIIWIDL